MADRYKALTLNCKGLNSPIKRRRVFTALEREHPDIVFLQETHLKPLDPTKPFIYRSRWFAHQFHAAGTSKARGVAILISKNVQFDLLSTSVDTHGHFIFVNCIINAVTYTLASLYAPNVEQLAFLEEVFTKLANFKAGEVLAGGDLNYVCDPSVDRSGRISGTKSHSNATRWALLRSNTESKLPALLDSFALVDVWRALYPSARQYTFFFPVHSTYS